MIDTTVVRPQKKEGSDKRREKNNNKDADEVGSMGRRVDWVWVRHRLVYGAQQHRRAFFLAGLIIAFCNSIAWMNVISLRISGQVKVEQVKAELWNVTAPESDKDLEQGTVNMSRLEIEEAELCLEHRPSQIMPRKGLIIDSNSEMEVRLKRTIEDELKKIPVMPSVNWGVYLMHRPTFPPELNMPSVKWNESYADGLPAQERIEDNQILTAHRKVKPVSANYTFRLWTQRMQNDKPKNVGMYLMGDELNFGSSFLNDFRTGQPNPFAFVIRDYYFDALKNAEHTQVIQLGTMTCQKRNLACSVKPPNSVFVNFLPPAVGDDMRPANLTKASERTRRCYWAGSIRRDRKQMAEYFETSGGCEIYVTPGFNRGHNKTVYADILADTVFGLVPSGNSPETHRLAEILMLGGIPAMLDEDAQAAHMLSYSEPIPVVSGRTWEDVDQRMREISDVELDQLQQRVIDWWDSHSHCVHEDLRWIIAQAHAVSDGRDLCTLFETPVEQS